MFPYIATSKFELKGIIQITSNLQFVSNVNKKKEGGCHLDFISSRFPMTGTIEEVGSDIKKLKEIGVDRAILVQFAGDGYDVDKSIQVAKELKKFAD